MSKCEIDLVMRTVSYRGVTVSLDLFEYFAEDANQGHLFEFVKRDKYGSVTVRSVERQDREGGGEWSDCEK